jgi:alpha-tubulin suppressor-like RCC1 family protein
MITFQNLTFGGTFSYETPDLPPDPKYYLWAWGKNNFGQLGLGNTTDISSPQQVGALTTWLNISAGNYHNLAIKTDGTMWSWGNHSDGR